MQKGRQREQSAVNGGQPARKRNSTSGSTGTALHPSETKSENGLASRTSSRTPAAVRPSVTTPTNGHDASDTASASATTATTATTDSPVTEPLISDDLTDAVSLPGIAGLPHIQRLEQTPEEAARSSRARRRFWLLASLALLLISLAVETINLSPWTDPITQQPPRQVTNVPLAEVNQYGVNVFLQKEVDQWKRDNTLQMAQDMGAGWIKQQFPWAEIEFAPPSSPAPYWDPQNKQSSWVKFDNIVDLAEKHGLRIIARIDSAPDWAKADDTMPKSVQDDLRAADHNSPPSPGHMKDFSDFIEKFVSRYKGRIAAIQVWNEPNLAAEWYRVPNAIDYTGLLKTAYSAAKSVDPDMIVLAAPLATTNENNGVNVNELNYLQAMYNAAAQCYNAQQCDSPKPYFDAMSANAYGKSLPPEDPPSNQVLNFRRVELLRKVMEDNGDSSKAIWFNEYGWNASPADCCVSLSWGRVTPQHQADYTARGIEYARQHWPWAGVFTIWYLRQVGDIPPSDSQYYFSLINSEFVPNSAYSAVKTAAHDQRKIATPGQWGSLSPVVSAGSRWQVHLSSDVPGGASVAPSAAAVDAGESIKLLFEGTDVKLTLEPLSDSASMTSTNAIKARYYVTVDGNSNDVASGLQRDDKGRAYIDLPTGAQATEVTVVQGLGAEFHTSQHELRITAGQLQKGGDEPDQGMTTQVASPLPDDRSVSLPGIGAFTIEARRSYVFFTVLTVLLVVAVGLGIWALWRNRPT